MDGISGFIKAMGYARLTAIAGVTGLVAAVLIFLMVWSGSPNMTLLYAGLDLADAAPIIEELESADIPYRQNRDGSAIFVPDSEVLSLRMQFAQDGLPSGGMGGYSILDDQPALGATSFTQNINLKRAMEGELARTISSLANIRSARVHLVMAERIRFRSESTQPTASVTLNPQRGELSRGEVQAIQHLVASAIQGLTPSRVAIIGTDGTLWANGTGDSNGGTAGGLDERQAEFENNLRLRIEDIISAAVGPNAVRVAVTADMDFSRTVVESQVFDPEGQVVRTSSLEEGTHEDTDATPAAAVSIGSELPEASQSTAATGSTNTESNLNEQISYDNSSTVSTIVQDGSRLMRLSVSVMVDGLQTAAADGTLSYTPRTEQEMTQIRALVRTAMGFDEARGDQLEVQNTRFLRTPVIIEDIEEPGLFAFDRPDMVRIIEVVIFALIALLTIFFVFRPIMKRLLAAPDPAALAASVNQAAIAAGGTPQLAAPDGTMPVAAPGAAPQQAIAAAPGQVPGLAPIVPMPAHASIDTSMVEGQVKESSIKKVGEIVMQHPDESVAILRSWLHESN